MIYESGVVTKVSPEGIWLVTQKQSACNACSGRSGCGQKLLNKWAGEEFEVFATYSQRVEGSAVLKPSTEKTIERSHEERRHQSVDITLNRPGALEQSVCSAESYKVGDEVAIAIREDAVVIGSLALYGLPLLCLMGLTFLADYFQFSTLAFAASVLPLSFYVSYLVLWRWSNSASEPVRMCQPVVVGRIENRADPISWQTAGGFKLPS